MLTFRSIKETVRGILIGSAILLTIGVMALGPVVLVLIVLACLASVAFAFGCLAGSVWVGLFVFAGLVTCAYIVLSAPEPRRRRHGQGNYPRG